MSQSARRSLLFAPATRPEIFAKALASGADLVCVDLEDAVAPDLKPAARPAGFDFLRAAAGDGAGGPERILRINGLKTIAGLHDLAALAGAGIPTGIVMLPKVESAEELRLADAVLTEAGSALKLAALVESVRGIEAAHAIAAATPRLDLMMFGGADLAAELGTRVAPEPMAYARVRLVQAARGAGIDLIDVPALDFRNPDAVAEDAARARDLGFTGKAALHPANVALVNAAFTPAEAEIAWARRVIEAFEASAGGVAVLDGKLIEKPVVAAQRRVLSRARAAGLLAA
ncbi:HpcH/HpaI aldolase/citrate lyase family protein [Tistrella mobilis]|uniref:HpcH/HpaI aldolase n=1 Tax=Tistrella mobilis (strain KA081020-065) TaxID=1110502 RepID=I3TUF7_TISMK|nr:CoA ester lyase [Tistrella mobilis]AFK56395.1 HpcH/HpaI aldolase [Tistrella mobilis KA081020-065]